jgi:AcrR family transcriptional regulator
MGTKQVADARYHHGDLRNALMHEALAVDSLEAMSLRQLAARVKVTPAAVYRHFDSKESLLQALAGIGFDRLSIAFAAAFAIHEPPTSATAARQRLLRLGEAYLAFADNEQALWRLMFSTLASAYRTGRLAEGRPSAFEYLPAALLGLHRTAVLSSAPSESDLLFAWGAIHGVAALRAGAIPLAQGTTPQLARDVVARVIAGLNLRPAAT